MSNVTVAEPDVTLLLDLNGVVRNATLASSFPDEDLDRWVGTHWTETVSDAGMEDIKRIVDDACAGGISAFRQVNQRFPSGREMPIEYTVVRLGGAAGLVAVGKSLQAVAELQARLSSAQQAVERDYWKMRDVETRYRMLFDASNEAVILADAENLNVIEANPAAIRNLGISTGNREVLREVADEDRAAFQRMVETTRVEGKAPRQLLHVGPAKSPWLVRASLMNGESSKIILLQFADSSLAVADSSPDTPLSNDIVAAAPDGIVVIDLHGIVRRANPAFLEMIDVGSERQVQGQSLATWLGRPGADLTVILSGVRRHGSLRTFSTVIEGTLGRVTEVEISAAAGGDDSTAPIVLTIRDTGARAANAAVDANNGALILPTVEQIGRRSISDIVDEIVATVEKYCIASALDITNDNRTAAADLLGLSRQSLYLKLHRYDLGGGAKVSRDMKG